MCEQYEERGSKQAMNVSEEQPLASESPFPSEGGAIRAFLVVRQGDRTWVKDLDRDQALDFGRSPSAHIVLDAPDVAPVHGQLFWDGRRISLRPVNARAHTFINGKRLEDATELVPGDELTVGSIQLVVGIAAPAASNSRRALTHQEFRERLWEETARAWRGGRPTALVMVHAKAGEGGHIASTALHSFRAGDVVGTFASDELEFLLPDTPRERASLVVGRVLAAAGVPATAGMAVAPGDGSHPERLLQAARGALEGARHSAEGKATDAPDAGVQVELVAEDASSRALMRRLRELKGPTSVLRIEGEIGTGKGAIARYVHAQGGGSAEHFLLLPCGNWSEADEAIRQIDAAAATLESWKLTSPGQGTLVLYDVCDLIIEGQKHLLRWFEQKPEALRIIATTHRKLEGLVERESFEPELLRRLEGEVIELLPLRQRSDDIIPLARHFVKQFGGSAHLHLGMGALARLQSYPWPANVLELRNAIERAVHLANGGEILAEHLPSETLPTLSGEGRLREHVDSVERDAIIKALADTNHNQTHAAKRLGISRRALIYKLEKYGLKPPAGTVRRGSS